jgi:hypothetical protein
MEIAERLLAVRHGMTFAQVLMPTCWERPSPT